MATPPSRFIQVTQDGAAPDLRSICERLIVSGRTLEKLEDAFHHFPNLLTLEDLVARYGSDWGIADEAINASKARSQYFDQIAGGQRYA